MPVVSNTSPVLNLAIVGRLSLLRKQFREILIPLAVLEELRVGEDLPGSQNVREAIEGGWLRVEELKDRTLVQVLERDLDRGEAEAIALALKVKAEWVLLDEKEARGIAKDLGLKVTGILGILLRAWREGDLLSLQREMEALREKAGFRIGQSLFIELVKESGEKQNSS
jgi:predicted nucleic acid-binding protein